MATRRTSPRSAWRWLWYLAVGLVVLLALLFVALQTSFAREQIRVRTNAALSQVFRGKLVIERIGGATLWGVSGVDARVWDERGRPVIRVQGLRAVAWLPQLGYELLVHADRPELAVSYVRMAHADVSLYEDEELGVSLAGAFIPRPSPTSPSTTPPDAGPRLRIERIVIDHIWAHGRVTGSPPLDAELRQLDASLTQSPRDGFALDLARVDLISRGLPFAADPRGRVSGVVEAPPADSGPLRLEGTLDGEAAGSPLALEASWVGDDLHARVSLLRLPASFVNQQAPGLELDGDLTLFAEADGPLPQLDFRAEADGTAGHVAVVGYAVVAQGLELCAALRASRLDLARGSGQAPESKLDLAANVLLLEADDGHFVGSHRVDVQPGQLANQQTPALWVSGRDELDTERGIRTWGKLGVDEPGATIRGGYDVRLPSGRESSVGVQLDAKLEEPGRLARLGVRAAGTASVSGVLYPERRALSGKASLSLRHVDQAVLQARNLEVRAEVSGSLDDPHAHAAATADLLSGRVHADLDYSNQNRVLDLFVADLDLLRLAHVLGQKMPLERGTLGLDAHLTGRGRSPIYSLDATANVDAGKVGSMKLRANQLELPAGAASPAQLGGLRGELTASGAIDLEAVSPLLTAAGVPIERTTGKMRFEMTARHRKDDAQGLELAAQVDTNGLRVVQERHTPDRVLTTSDAIASKPTALEGIDLHFSAHAWPRSGDVVGTLILRDAGGTLLETQAAAQLGPGFARSGLDARTLSRMPLKATLAMPRRRLGTLPAIVRPSALRGRLAFEASLDGSLDQPSVTAHVSAQSLRTAGSKVPVDVDADVAYERAGGKLSAKALRPTSSSQVGSVEASWQGDLRLAAQPSSDALGVTADVEVMLRDFPLDVVPQITDRQVAGQLSGDIKLRDFGQDAQLKACFSSTTLAVGKVAISKMTAALETKADKLSANVALNVGSGSALATLEQDAHWGRRVLPALGHRGVAKLETHAFQLEALSPLLTAYVSEIGGVLDASTQIVVSPEATTLSGTAALEHGVVQLPAIGQRFSDISARFSVADDQLKLERLNARGTTGRLSAKGAARLDGFELRGADVHVVIKKNESLPLTLEGAEIGDAWGSVNAVYVSPERGERKLQIDVPEFHLLAPEMGSHGLQSLEPDDEIRVGVRRADGQFVPLPIQPLEAGGESSGAAEAARPLIITVKLGNDVSVERGRSARAQLTGQLTIESARETEVRGRIEVRGGRIDVQGKTFEIERGVITFEGTDPGNPTITATARWDAPGYTVYADYVGDVKNGRIRLHSEPPLTQDEIASLLLFGSPEGSPTSGTDSNAALAVGVAGNTAAKGLNQVLDDFTKLDVSARVDTTTGTARPELVFQVSPRVSAKVTRAVGAPAAGESPDRTFLTLELRLRRAWALSAIFGDHGGSALDLIWRRRY